MPPFPRRDLAESRGLSPSGDPGGGLTNVDMGAGSGTRNGAPGGHERNAGRSEMLHQRPSLQTIRMHGHVERIAVVEAHAVMQWRLPEGADGECPPESGEEELLQPGRAQGQG